MKIKNIILIGLVGFLIYRLFIRKDKKSGPGTTGSNANMITPTKPYIGAGTGLNKPPDQQDIDFTARPPQPVPVSVSEDPVVNISNVIYPRPPAIIQTADISPNVLKSINKM